MLIANLRSNSDLVNKRELQAQLLQLEVQNEAELEKRVKDFKNPNKPIPVAPEYKTNAELQKDRLKQERQAISNMEELGFDYNKSAELVAWLSSSLINRLIEFNANFKGIKKELVETTNPKLLSLDFIKNYLEKYFEDVDINFGRKLGGQDITGTLTPATIDDLTRTLPTEGELNALSVSIRAYIDNELTDSKDFLNGEIGDISLERDNALGHITEEDKRAPDVRRNFDTIFQQYKRLLGERYDMLERLTNLQNSLEYSLIYIDKYKAVLPTAVIDELRKTLTQQERGDLIRRYMTVLKTAGILDLSGVNELIDDWGSVDRDNPQQVALLGNKTRKGLNFLTNENSLKQVSKLSRDYEIMASQSSKPVDDAEIKRLNDISDKEEQKARDAEARQQQIEDDRIAQLRQAREDLERYEVVKQTSIELGVKLRERRERKEEEAERLMEIERQKEAKRVADEEEAERQRIEREKQVVADAIIDRVIAEQRRFLNDMDDYSKVNLIGAIYTVRDLLDTTGFLTKDKSAVPPYKPKGMSDVDWYAKIRNELTALIQSRIDAYSARPVDEILLDDFTFVKPELYRLKTRQGKQTNYGVGLKEGIRKDLRSHMKEDEKYEKQIAKSLKNIHQKMEDSSDEEDMGRRRVQIPERNLGFQHRKIKVGGGIARAEKKPTYAQFGKYVIHLPHLLERNVANFKYPSLGSIPAIKAQTISEDYKQFLIDTLQNKKPNERLLSKLLPDEQRHFERVVAGAGLLEEFKLKRDPSDADKKDGDRFQLLRGEVMAGNNSDKVLKELRGLIVRFMNEDRITKKEGTSMLLELSAL
jgi:hypothetical protein